MSVSTIRSGVSWYGKTVALKLKEWQPFRLEEGGRETLAAAHASQPASQSVSVSHMHVHGRHSLVQMALVVDGTREEDDDGTVGLRPICSDESGRSNSFRETDTWPGPPGQSQPRKAVSSRSRPTRVIDWIPSGPCLFFVFRLCHHAA